MESGSLLPAALRHMERQRMFDDGDDANVGEFAAFDDENDWGGIGGDGQDCEPSSVGGGEGGLVHNALAISVYPLDSSDDILLPSAVRSSTATATATATAQDSQQQRQQQQQRAVALYQKLATLGNLLNTAIIPTLNRSTPYPWHLAGSTAPTFGVHCSPPCRLPHLRSVIRYGPSVTDEWFAVALLYHVTTVLKSQYGLRVGVELIDVDDGQLLLIEGAGCLPAWVDDVDVLGEGGMDNRCWLVEGTVRIIPPPPEVSSVGNGRHRRRGGRDGRSLSRAEALSTLLPNSPIDTTTPAVGVQRAVLDRIDPFLTALRRTAQSNLSAASSASYCAQVPPSMKECLHRAAVIVPLDVAILLQEEPALISAAVQSFCKHECRNKQPRRRDQPPSSSSSPRSGSGSSSSSGGAGSIVSIRFENLVPTVITTTRTTYAILLTGGGLLPPPLPIPKEYRSVELNRMKRTLRGEAVQDRYRHALEGGMRLTLGLEGLLRESLGGGGGSNDEGGKAKARDGATNGQRPRAGGWEETLSETERRVRIHWSRIDAEASSSSSGGGNGNGNGRRWIDDAYVAGPNGAATASKEEKECIDAMIKCPVYRPEVSRSGWWPLTHPGKSAGDLVREELMRLRKKKASSSRRKAGARCMTAADFPMTREDDVDWDGWLDLDGSGEDGLERKMAEAAAGTAGCGGAQQKSDGGEAGAATAAEEKPAKDRQGEELSINNDQEGPQSLDVMLEGLQSFVQSKSDVEGVATQHPAGGGQRETQGAPSDTQSVDEIGAAMLERDVIINPRVLVGLLHHSLTSASSQGGREVKAEDSSRDGVQIDSYFSAEDYMYNLDGSECDSSEDDEGQVGGSAENDDDDGLLGDVMAAMDEELRDTKVEREGGGHSELMGSEGDERRGITPQIGPDDDGNILSTNIDVISNLLKSLDAQGGGPGPVSNLLQELGLDPPKQAPS